MFSLKSSRLLLLSEKHFEIGPLKKFAPGPRQALGGPEHHSTLLAVKPRTEEYIFLDNFIRSCVRQE